MHKMIFSIGVAALALGGCGKSAEPTGQVVATVGGKEVTASELRLEQGQAEVSPAMQQAAFQNLVNRKLLAEEARRLKLDKTPAAAMMMQRAEETALVQLLEQNIAKSVPQVSADEARAYISSHPANFANRQLINVDQMMVPEVKPEIVRQMESLKTQAEFEALLNSNNIRFVRTAGVLDTLTLNAQGAQKLATMPVGEMFVSPIANGQGVSISRISGKRVEPLSGADAERAARQLLMAERGGQQVRERMKQIITAGQKSVEINPAFKPQTGAAGAAKPPVAAPAK